MKKGKGKGKKLFGMVGDLIQREFDKSYLTSPPTPLRWRQPAVRQAERGAKSLIFRSPPSPKRRGRLGGRGSSNSR